METNDAVRDHYASMQAGDDLLTLVRRALDAMPDAPRTAAQLAGFDQFHIRGLTATIELAERAAIAPETRVLDAGSGIGGPSRYLAETYGCRVAGVDITPAFVETARLLAERAGLAERVAYTVGDLQALPFADAAFDLVWTQHVVMNVPDRDRAYREFRRVLAPGGNVVFYDVVAGDGADGIHLPVPWSETAATSFLLTEAQTRAAFSRAALAVETWTDLSDAALAWIDRLATAPAPPQPGLSLAAVVGPRFGLMSKNFGRNLREGRIRVVAGNARRADAADQSIVASM